MLQTLKPNTTIYPITRFWYGTDNRVNNLRLKRPVTVTYDDDLDLMYSKFGKSFPITSCAVTKANSCHLWLFSEALLHFCDGCCQNWIHSLLSRSCLRGFSLMVSLLVSGFSPPKDQRSCWNKKQPGCS